MSDVHKALLLMMSLISNLRREGRACREVCTLSPSCPERSRSASARTARSFFGHLLLLTLGYLAVLIPAGCVFRARSTLPPRKLGSSLLIFFFFFILFVFVQEEKFSLYFGGLLLVLELLPPYSHRQSTSAGRA
jgi:hypothetical protein